MFRGAVVRRAGRRGVGAPRRRGSPSFLAARGEIRCRLPSRKRYSWIFLRSSLGISILAVLAGGQDSCLLVMVVQGLRVGGGKGPECD